MVNPAVAQDNRHRYSGFGKARPISDGFGQLKIATTLTDRLP